jgi:DNA-nicking Smr family endonuclease
VKCGEDVRLEVAGKVVEIDVAHDRETVDDALRKLGRALDRAVIGWARGLKVIHGYGSSGRRGAIGPAVKRWLRTEAQRQGWKVAVDKFNPGATILWLESRHGR